MTTLAQAVAIGAARALLRFTPPREGIERDEVERDFREARAAFKRFLALEAAHDPALLDFYGDDGLIVERRVEAGVEKAREITMRRYKKQLAKALAISRKAGEASRHYDVSFERVAPGWVIVRSWRDYSHAREPAPYEAVFTREVDGRWRVRKETATLVI